MKSLKLFVFLVSVFFALAPTGGGGGSKEAQTGIKFIRNPSAKRPTVKDVMKIYGPAYKALKEKAQKDSRGYLTRDQRVQITNQIAKKYKVDAEALYKLIHLSESVYEEELRRNILLSRAFGNEVRPTKIPLDIPADVPVAEFEQYLRGFLIQRFKKDPGIAIVTLLDSQLKPITEKWFSRRLADKGPIEIRYTIVSTYKLSFKFFGNGAVITPITVEFDESTKIGVIRKHLKEHLQKKLQTKPTEVTIIYNGRNLDDAKRIKELDKEEFEDNGFLVFYK